MKTLAFLILSIFFYFILGCVDLVDHVYSIKIENNTNDTIQFYASFDYPDTSISLSKPDLKMIYPKDFSYLDSKEEWENVLPKDTLLVFLFKKDTVDLNSWGVIVNNYKVLKKITLSLKDIDNLNNTITYP